MPKQLGFLETFDAAERTPVKRPPVARARNTDASTSHEAAEFINRTGTAKAHCDKILAVVRAEEGLTAVEIGARVGLTSVQVTKRFVDLAAFVEYGPKKKVPGHPTSFQTWWLKKE